MGIGAVCMRRGSIIAARGASRRQEALARSECVARTSSTRRPASVLTVTRVTRSGAALVDDVGFGLQFAAFTGADIGRRDAAQSPVRGQRRLCRGLGETEQHAALCVPDAVGDVRAVRQRAGRAAVAGGEVRYPQSRSVKSLPALLSLTAIRTCSNSTRSAESRSVWGSRSGASSRARSIGVRKEWACRAAGPAP